LSHPDYFNDVLAIPSGSFTDGKTSPRLSVNFADDELVATLERLVATIADVDGIGAERVRAIARVMREAGLIATRGRGMSAAEMSVGDAANLLIAVNVADTARTAPEMVKRYRRLRASSKTWSAYFGTEFEKLLAAARIGTMADSVAHLVRLAPGRSPLVSNRYDAEEYEFEIGFRKPLPAVTIYVAAPRGERPDAIRFSERAENSSAIVSDRIVGVAITERTIFAVGELLRD